ncbi:Imidazole glycerol phosphate synthase subunit HisH [Saliniradius amylolyticus]|uniref:Imidazole glycerol phosphate synthase subunit HisH n=1 Tax=Saliniradius amylolyticus TaxID=2183582 RepID=A0A2S2E1F3_9ALTE|nr:imidazole glycerol phosphate synthase subunit HisH [Saliniradius amylolyticus]AWL11463.1 Imidazole glycerol phosphate synthase subunit HisH [Saliniradius amylolyticus]
MAKQPNLVIVDTGCANISSVRFAIERLGYEVTVSDHSEVIKAADKVFLPGVGAAKAAMEQIANKGLIQVLPSLTQPVLGICLGMQLMTRYSEEGMVDCLSLINQDDARVSRMQVGDLRLPHMGWNTVQPTQDSPLFDGIDEGSYFYFVHSFSVPPGDYTLAECDYNLPFSAAIGQNNFYGVQFHPERSGPVGARLLKNFIELCD